MQNIITHDWGFFFFFWEIVSIFLRIFLVIIAMLMKHLKE